MPLCFKQEGAETPDVGQRCDQPTYLERAHPEMSWRLFLKEKDGALGWAQLSKWCLTSF